MNDQILFWDTAADATVSLSKSKEALRQKIISSSLIGGHLVIRPAELFEGEEFYIDDATQKDGLLYNLMKNGGASLALDKKYNIYERAEWRFRHEGVVFDRGIEYTQKPEIDKIKSRTFYRADRIEAAGWKSCPTQRSRSPNELVEDLNFRARCLLSKISNEYFYGGLEEDTAINSFIHGGQRISSRADLYKVVKEIWAKDVNESQKPNFVNDCSSALTLATISNTADVYGDRVSEVGAVNYRLFSINSPVSGIRAGEAETTALKSFLRVFPQKMRTLESEQNHFAGTALNLDARKFVEASMKAITSRDREELKLLLHGPSNYLNGSSITEHIHINWEGLKQQEIDNLIKIRIDELSDLDKIKAGERGGLISMMRSCAAEAILLCIEIKAPLISTLGGSLIDLRFNRKPSRPIFCGFRTKI